MTGRALPLALTAGLLALAANAAVAVGVVTGRTMLSAVAVVPLAALALGALIASHRSILLFAALALPLLPLPLAHDPLPVPGGAAVFAADLVVLVALGAWIAAWLLAEPGARPRWPRTPVLGWPFVLFAIAIVAGVVRGHERYGASIVGQPLRLILYAGIAAALCTLTAREAHRGIVAVFYAGAFLQGFLGLYYLATGTSQTDQVSLSTGGTRFLALGTAIYLSGALVLALANLELEEGPRRRALHLAVAGVAAFGVVLAFGRTNFAVLGLLLPVMFLGLRRMRVTVLGLLPLVVPFLVIGAIVVPRVAPDLVPTFADRVTGTTREDTAVRWREHAAAAVLEGVDAEPVLGVGFGRSVTFRIEDRDKITHGDPHNSYIFLLAGGGVLALGAFIVLALTFLADAWRRLRRATGVERALLLWSAFFGVIFLVNLATGPILTQPQFVLTMWALMFLPALVPLADREGAKAVR